MSALRAAAVVAGLASSLVLSGCGRWKAPPARPTLGEVYQAIAASTADDSDGDGLPNDVERRFAATLGTNPDVADSDGDGLNDAFELFGTSWIYVASGGKAGHLDPSAPAARADDPARAHAADENVDTDGDGVPDYLEFAGYRYDPGTARFVLDPNGFHTDPLQWSTDQDAYSDGMEVSGINMDVAVREPGNDPLVAAYPDIVVELVGYTVTANETITDGHGGQVSKGESWSHETRNDHATWNENMVEVSGGFKAGKGKDGGFFEFNVGLKYAHTWKTVDTSSDSTSTGTSRTDQVNWSQARSYNPVDAARLKLMVKVHNRGTAPASNVVPTLNVRIGGANVATFAPTDLAIQTLVPGGSYPAEPGVALVLDSDGAGHPLVLTDWELRALESGAPIALTVTQKRADVMRLAPDGTWERVGDAGEYLARILSVSANLFVDLGPLPGGEQARFLHALVYADDAPTAPRVTLRDGLAAAFGFKGDDEAGYTFQYPELDGTFRTVGLVGSGDGSWRWGLDAATAQQAWGGGAPESGAVLLRARLTPTSDVSIRAPRPAGEELPTIHSLSVTPLERGYEIVVCASDYDGIARVVFIDKAGHEHSLAPDGRGAWFYATILEDYAFAGSSVERIRVDSLRTLEQDGVVTPLSSYTFVSPIYTPTARPPLVRAMSYDTATRRFFVRVEPGGELELDQVAWVRLYHPALGTGGDTPGMVDLHPPLNWFEEPTGWEAILDQGWFAGMRLVAYSKGGRFTSKAVANRRDLDAYRSGSASLTAYYNYEYWETHDEWRIDQADLEWPVSACQGLSGTAFDACLLTHFDGYRSSGPTYNKTWPAEGPDDLLTDWRHSKGVDDLPDVYLRSGGNDQPFNLAFFAAGKRIFDPVGRDTYDGFTYASLVDAWPSFTKGRLSSTPSTTVEPTFDYVEDGVLLFETSAHRLGKLIVTSIQSKSECCGYVEQTVGLDYTVYKKAEDIAPTESFGYASPGQAFARNYLVGSPIGIAPTYTTGGDPDWYRICSGAEPTRCEPASEVLPPGLSFNEATGELYGTPTASQGLTDLVVFAGNLANELQSLSCQPAELLIAVQQAPSGFAYSPDAQSCPTGRLCLVAPVSLPTGDVDQFLISPPLPAGLNLVGLNGVVDGSVSGTPTEVTGQRKFTVTATNLAGASASASFTLETPLGTPRYPRSEYTFPAGTALADVGQSGAIQPAYLGAGVAYAVSPPLPAALSVDPDTGLLRGTPQAGSARAPYTVTATRGAATTSAVLYLTVTGSTP